MNDREGGSSYRNKQAATVPHLRKRRIDARTARVTVKGYTPLFIPDCQSLWHCVLLVSLPQSQPYPQHIIVIEYLKKIVCDRKQTSPAWPIQFERTGLGKSPTANPALKIRCLQIPSKFPTVRVEVLIRVQAPAKNDRNRDG